MTPRRLLFMGSAPVHFACAWPVCQRLAGDPRVEIWYTGGFKKTQGETASYSLEGFYDPFGVDPRRVIPLERAQAEDFDVLLCSHLNPVLPKSFRKSVQFFHGVSFKNLLVREKYTTFNYLCLAGRYHAEVYRRKGYVRADGGACLVTGFAKVDRLVDGSLDRASTLRRCGADPGRPAVLYAPTGSKHNSMETMGLEVIRAVGGAGRWNLLVKLHDHPKVTDVDWAREVERLETDRVRLVRDWDIVPYLHAADLVLTDASSASVEFSLLDRPVVFLDVPELFKDVLERGGALDLDTWGRRIGRVVAGPGEAACAIEDALAHPARESDVRRAMARHVFHDPGRATARCAAVVLHAAGLLEELPPDIEVLKPEAVPCRS
jgi:hypothetical protein